MIENFNNFLDSVAKSDLGKAARKSARTIWNAQRAAFETTHHEAGKVFGVAINESQKLSTRVLDRREDMIDNLAGVADEQLTTIEHSLQQGMSRVIRRVGLPTAKDVNSLSRRVDALTARVNSRAARKPKRRATRRAA
ncbi:MAG TPA: phasin family protein [Steroidobacteraceae bacterium]|nr:phasin family protein [Steroidobacteraceae bacterium]